MKRLRELLDDAVPDLPPASDRLAEVGRRVRRRRQARGVALTGVVAVVTVGALAGTQWLGRDRPAGPPFAQHGSSFSVGTSAVEPLDCPPLGDEPPKTGQGAGGPVADESATGAVLCAYQPGGQVVSRGRIDRDVDGLVRAMNELPDLAAFRVRHPEAVEAGCFMMARPQYRIVLAYPDGPSRVVAVNLNCGTLARDDVVRYGDVTRPLDEFATLLRARGGDFPPPPWSW